MQGGELSPIERTAARTGQYLALLGYWSSWPSRCSGCSPRRSSRRASWRACTRRGSRDHPTLAQLRQAFDEQDLRRQRAAQPGRRGLASRCIDRRHRAARGLRDGPAPLLAQQGRDRLGGGQPGVPVRADDHPAVPGAAEPGPDQHPAGPDHGVRRLVAAVRAVDAAGVRPRACRASWRRPRRSTARAGCGRWSRHRAAARPRRGGHRAVRVHLRLERVLLRPRRCSRTPERRPCR